MNENIFHSNIKIIQERWPLIALSIYKSNNKLCATLISGAFNTIAINNLQICSRYNPHQEALVQSKTIPPTEIVTLYGFGMGHLAQYLLEQRPEIKKIQLVILNVDVVFTILHTIDLSAILENKKIELLMGNDEAKIRYPYFAHSPDLHLCDTSCVRLRNLISHDKTIQYNQHRFNSLQDDITERITSNLELIQTDGDVSVFFDSAIEKKALVIGAGPTLDQSLQWCKQQLDSTDRPLIIAVDTALKPLAHFHIKPDIVVSIDMHKRDKFYYVSMEQTPLVYAPILANEVLRAWPGPRYVTYFNLPAYDTWKKSHPKGSLMCLSSVIHTATDLAVKMGAKDIYFLGADFGFPKGKSYAQSLEKFSKPQDHLTEWLLDGHGNKIYTQPNMLGYLLDLEIYIQSQPQIRFYNTSRDGATIAGTSYINHAKL